MACIISVGKLFLILLHYLTLKKGYPVLFKATLNSFFAVLCDLLILTSINKLSIILEFLHAIFHNFFTFFQ